MRPEEKIFDIEKKLADLINGEMEEIVGKAADEQTGLMADLIVQQQRAGIDGTGLAIIPSYARKTIEIKRKKGQVFDRVTLEDEGNYHRGERAVKTGKAYLLESTDSKAEELQKKYGDDIQKLTEYSLNEVSMAMLPDLEILTKNYLRS